MIKTVKMLVLFSLLIMLISGTAVAAQQHHTAQEVEQPLALGEDWPVDESTTIKVTYSDEAGVDVWILFDENNLYVQYDVTTPYPQRNNYSDHDIWRASSFELALSHSTTIPMDQRVKWIMTRTTNGDYVIVTREDRTIIPNGEGVELKIVDTDFGYRGQVIFDLSNPFITSYNPADNNSVYFHLKVNDSKDGQDRTALMRLPGSVQEPSTFHVLTFKK